MLELSAIFVAGFRPGTINVVVGSGALVTFPVLLLFGYSPLTANISNSFGLAAGASVPVGIAALIKMMLFT